jgi:hypothetical protein
MPANDFHRRLVDIAFWQPRMRPRELARCGAGTLRGSTPSSAHAAGADCFSKTRHNTIADIYRGDESC